MATIKESDLVDMLPPREHFLLLLGQPYKIAVPD